MKAEEAAEKIPREIRTAIINSTPLETTKGLLWLCEIYQSYLDPNMACSECAMCLTAQKKIWAAIIEELTKMQWIYDNIVKQ